MITRGQALQVPDRPQFEPERQDRGDGCERQRSCQITTAQAAPAKN
jgi:hypothetical protein